MQKWQDVNIKKKKKKLRRKVVVGAFLYEKKENKNKKMSDYIILTVNCYPQSQ